MIRVGIKHISRDRKTEERRGEKAGEDIPEASIDLDSDSALTSNWIPLNLTWPFRGIEKSNCSSTSGSEYTLSKVVASKQGQAKQRREERQTEEWSTGGRFHWEIINLRELVFTVWQSKWKTNLFLSQEHLWYRMISSHLRLHICYHQYTQWDLLDLLLGWRNLHSLIYSS